MIYTNILLLIEITSLSSLSFLSRSSRILESEVLKMDYHSFAMDDEPKNPFKKLNFNFFKKQNGGYVSMDKFESYEPSNGETVEKPKNNILKFFQNITINNNNNQSNEMNTFDKFLFVFHLLHRRLSSSLVVKGLLSALCSNQCSWWVHVVLLSSISL